MKTWKVLVLSMVVATAVVADITSLICNDVLAGVSGAASSLAAIVLYVLWKAEGIQLNVIIQWREIVSEMKYIRRLVSELAERYHVLLSRNENDGSENRWTARCAEWAGFSTRGRSKKEVMRRMHEMLASMILERLVHGDEIPMPKGREQ